MRRFGKGKQRSIGLLLLPLLCLGYFGSEAILRRQCYHVAAAQSDDKMRKQLLEKLPAFVRRPLAENLKRRDAEAAVAAAATPAEKCERLRDLLGLVSHENALALHRQVVELCPNSPESSTSFLEVLGANPGVSDGAGEYVDFLSRLAQQGVSREKQQVAWERGLPLVENDEERLLDYLTRAAMARWVAAEFGDHYRRMRRLCLARGHRDAAALAARLASRCDEVAISELNKSQEKSP